MRVSTTGALSSSSAFSKTLARPDLSCSLDSSSWFRMIVGSPHETARLTASIIFSTSERSEVRMRMSRSFPADTSSDVEKKESCGIFMAPRGCFPNSHIWRSLSRYLSSVHPAGRTRSKDWSSTSSDLAAGDFLARSARLSHQSRICFAAPPESTNTTTGRACFSVASTFSSVLGPPPTTSSTIGGVGSGWPSSSLPKEVVHMQVSNSARRSISQPKALSPSLPSSTKTKCEWLGSMATRRSSGRAALRSVMPP
mmetsp:Transcript_30002/g.81953  ORF Transcript_30002/g.81953 Transcript_30002/m.81953 type:complete len:254 (-) Transcript_30002:768-1529(-)